MSAHTVNMPIGLLGAIARFAIKDDTRPQLMGVLVNRTELVACDGHRLVRVDMRCGPFDGSDFEGDHAPYLIPLEVANALVAGAKVCRGKRARITCVDRTLRVDIISYDDHVVLSAERKVASLEYPPIDQIMIETRAGEAPVVLDAMDCARRGLTIKGWGDHVSPMLFEGDGVRFVVMPMRAL